MKKIEIIVADNSYLIRGGFASLINKVTGFTLIKEAARAEELSEQLLTHRPDVLIIDYTSRYFCLDDLFVIREHFPEVNILAITSPAPKSIISKAIECGIISHLLKDCGEEEIIDAIYCTAKRQKFLCGTIVDEILKEETGRDSVSCGGIRLTDREIEIIQLIAEGLANKQIASKLFLSLHTVSTHRKNMMSKLGVNNTASLVMYAIRENWINSEFQKVS